MLWEVFLLDEFEALKKFKAELTARGIISDPGRMEVQLLGLAEKLAEKVKQLESQTVEEQLKIKRLEKELDHLKTQVKEQKQKAQKGR
jgi:molecular chaperone GrpE (heat shock protein)